MRVKSFGLALAGALALVGCSRDAGPFFAPTVPLAYTRFVNAIPDTFSLDWRFIDQLEYSPVELTMNFRGFSPYQGTAVGARPLRVFTNPGGNGPSIPEVSAVILDETVNLEAGKYYSLIAVGFSRAGQTPASRLLVLEDPIPTALASQVAFRVVHLGSGLGPVNVSTTPGAADAIGAPVFSNVAYLQATAYNTMAPTTITTTGTGCTSNYTAANLFLRVVNVATAAELSTGNGACNDARRAPGGVDGSAIDNLTTIGGLGKAGSALTAFVMPASVAGSKARSFTTPGVVWVVDKHPR